MKDMTIREAREHYGDEFVDQVLEHDLLRGCTVSINEDGEDVIYETDWLMCEDYFIKGYIKDGWDY